MSAAFGRLDPVSTDWTTPSSVATARSASAAPGSREPSVVSRSLRAARRVANSAPNGASSRSDSPSARRLTPLRPSASKKISGSVMPTSCGSWTSGRPVTAAKASAYAALVTLATSSSVRSMFHRTSR